MEYREFTGKTVDEAIINAKTELSATTEELEYEVIDKGSTGLFGIGSHEAVIKARRNVPIVGLAEEFLAGVFEKMNMDIKFNSKYDDVENEIYIDLVGDDMGILIGKRGQTLDSLQYLASLVVNKDNDKHIRVKLDIENYRERRAQTLETLAKNIAKKVKRTHKEVELEPMNPYERRIIHSTLQNDRYVVTRSEGEEPYRFVVVSLKRDGNGKGSKNRDRD